MAACCAMAETPDYLKIVASSWGGVTPSDNAVKFTPSGGRVTLCLRTAWATTDGGVSAEERPGSRPGALLAVSDTGMGIPPGAPANLFARFFRASTAQRNAVPGVGLGLA